MRPGRRRALLFGSSCSAPRRLWRPRPAAQASSGREAWGRSGVCIAPLPFPPGFSCPIPSPSAIPCGRARPCLENLSVRRAGCGGRAGSRCGCRFRPSLAPPTPRAERQRPAADGVAVLWQPCRWARHCRRRPPSWTQSRPLPVQAGPALGPRRRHARRSAHALRSPRCRRRRQGAACAIAAGDPPAGQPVERAGGRRARPCFSASHSPWPNSSRPVLSSTRWIGSALASTRGWRPANARPRRLNVVWSGTGRANPSRRSTLRLNASACRRARRNTSRKVSTSSMASSEYSGCPPGLLRFGAAQPLNAASSNQSVRSPRRRSPASRQASS